MLTWGEREGWESRMAGCREAEVVPALGVTEACLATCLGKTGAYKTLFVSPGRACAEGRGPHSALTPLTHLVSPFRGAEHPPPVTPRAATFSPLGEERLSLQRSRLDSPKTDPSLHPCQAQPQLLAGLLRTYQNFQCSTSPGSVLYIPLPHWTLALKVQGSHPSVQHGEPLHECMKVSDCACTNSRLL